MGEPGDVANSAREIATQGINPNDLRNQRCGSQGGGEVRRGATAPEIYVTASGQHSKGAARTITRRQCLRERRKSVRGSRRPAPIR